MGILQMLPLLATSILVFSASAAPSSRSPIPELFRKPLTRRSGNGTCLPPADVPVVAKKPSPFTPLSEIELDDVKAWLYSPEQNLNLTSTTSETLSQTDNYIWIIESLYPNKTDVLSYLDGNASMPDHYARVVINEGGKAVPDVSEYFVSFILDVKNISLANIVEGWASSD
jgi:primary-amine oxidase